MLRLLVAFIFVLTSPALADEFSTPWSSGQKSRARLVAGGELSAGHYRAGIEVELAPAAITYWRNPGEAGLPPSLSFEGSDNLASVSMRFPAPERLLESGIMANGYEKTVIFPLEIVALDSSLPVRLNYRFDYAVCEKLCLPAQASGMLSLPHMSGPHAGDLDAAEAKIPKPQPLGAQAALSIVSVAPEQGLAKPAFLIDITAPAAAELFAEVPEPLFATLEPMSSRRFRLRFDPVPPATDLGAQVVRLTLVSGAQAIETQIRLDGRPVTP